MIGTSISHYKVTSKLGEGGMGEVWRAEDTRLGRDVALKMLPPAVAHDPERLARFEREARVLAALSHPNIAGIYGLEEQDGQRFLVMEVAEGETLAERIERGRIPQEEAVRIALQIAEALEAAHVKGIIHRDLKPANVKLSTEGRVKVLDFGLAKALAGGAEAEASSAALEMSPTLTQAMTAQGVLMGTAGYMSPEQARARPVDRRADIWAFGCVVFEMLSGQRAFKGDTAADVIGAIVHKEPELDDLPASVSPRLRRLVERCLRKDGERRLQSIGDARIALQEWLENPIDPVERSTAVRSGAAVGWPVAIAAAAFGALATWLALSLFEGEGEASSEPVRRFEQPISGGALAASGIPIALTRDGTRIAYLESAGDDTLRLAVRRFDQREATTVVEGSREALDVGVFPFFSPDGEWIAYFTQGGLVKSTQGGAAIRIADVERGAGGSWSESDRIVYSHDGDGPAAEGLYVISAAGGERERLTTPHADDSYHEHHRWPQWLPGQRAVLFTNMIHGGAESGPRIEAVELDGGERTVIQTGGSYARWVDTGHLVFVNGGTLYALAFDPATLEASGAPLPILEGIAFEANLASATFAVSDDGLLAYVEGEEQAGSFPILWADREGRTSPLLERLGLYGGPVLSPSGDRLAVARPRDDNWDVWIYDLERGVSSQLTHGPGYDADAIWSPDGSRIAFTSDREDSTPTLFVQRSDGAGEAERLLEPGVVYFPSPLSWSPDGNRLLVIAAKESGQRTDLFFLDLESGALEPFVEGPATETEGVFSPDGRFVAYRSHESGTPQVYVRAVEDLGRWQISNEAGAQPRWSRDGTELFFRGPAGLMRVEVSTDGGFRAGRPELLFQGPLGPMTGVTVPGYSFPDYDVGPDGRFVILPRRSEEEEDAVAIQYVTGWFRELRRLTAQAGTGR
ncbi:MAG TPA: protein kinase [Thermoanaerobaculia bacterium]|nr:protein kinase [Thermoanaerobaculia bacterium]